MTAKPNPDAHPGLYIREQVIPRDLSVKDAAKRLGVGRPALSNLLNGNSALSPEMALRLETAFGADRQKLLDLQAAYDAQKQSVGEQPVTAAAYVPSVISIKAHQLEDWAEKRIEARTHLAALLRMLVNSTGRELLRVDFPAYDNAERKGWDGTVETTVETAWVPPGKSGWEFGCSKDPESKANDDYAARTSSVPADERANTVFVFVTPRNWNKKKAWIKAKKALGEWRDIRVHDASDLEQWLDQSATAQVWLAERLGLPTGGYRTLDQCWSDWCLASEPPLSSKLLSPSIASHASGFKSWLATPPDRPFIIAADSRGEGLAFIACLFGNPDIQSVRSGDSVLVFDQIDAVIKFATASSGSLVMVAHTTDVEKEFAAHYRRFHCIIVRPRNAVDAEPDIALDLLRHSDFEKALTSMKIDADDIDRLSRESARSPTILRRRLSRIDAIKTPDWARDAVNAKKLLPVALIGAWHEASKADCEVVAMLAGESYQNVESDIARLLQFDDTPIWSVGQYRGVTSKIDVLFAIARYATKEDLENFLLAAEYVLSEVDPALDLPEDKRVFAGLYGKVREHSGALRSGICETLVMLAVHGNTLFFSRLGFDAESRVTLLVRKLLTPLTLEKLLSHDRDLPNYAEAAPDEVLYIIEKDLRSDRVVFGLLKPVDAGIFGGGCPRTGLLWALETLAWRPQTLRRVADILAQLSTTKIDDNWVNKPEHSLQAIFRSWMPQTAATVEQRIQVLDHIAKTVPDIGWSICVDQFDPGSRTGDYTHRPRWRNDASGAGQPVSRKESYQFAIKCVEMAIAWPDHNERTLGDLVERLQALSDQHQAAIWDLVDRWAEGSRDEAKKALLRERIRRYAFTRRSRIRGINQQNVDRARQSSTKLLPGDLVIRHEWLFRSQWVEESAEEIEGHDFDYRKRERRIQEQRTAALREIWEARGMEGISELLTRSGAPHIIGHIMLKFVKGPRASVQFARACVTGIASNEHSTKYESCLRGFLIALPKAADMLAAKIEKACGKDGLLSLFLCMPFEGTTWSELETRAPDLQKAYWRRVAPHWGNHASDEVNELTDRLVEAGRPLAAFHAVHLDWSKVETSRLTKLLHAVATSGRETPPAFKMSQHDVGEAFRSLDSRPGVTTDEKAQLEFMFLDALDHNDHGIPNLEKQIASSSSMFVQAVALAFKRNDGGIDPPEWVISEPERHSSVAGATYSLLDRIRRVPGTDENGVIKVEDLKAWLLEARTQLKKLGRAEIGDERIGQILSRTPVGNDGAWPCRPICEAMEWMSSEQVARGFHVGTRNSRGVHWRGEGGDQERDLATRYRKWADAIAFEFPYVAGVLGSIASSYQRDAQWEDNDAKVRSRLPYV